MAHRPYVARRTDRAKWCVHPPKGERSTVALTAIETRRKEHIMNKDQVKGRIKTAKGQLKVVAGNVVSNERLIEEGKGEKVVGKIQAGYGDIKHELESGE